MSIRQLRINLPFVALALCLVSATAIASLLFVQLTRERLGANKHPMEDMAWALFQVQAEHQRVRLLLAETELHPSEEAQQAALMRYEIFVSRLPIMTEGNIRQRLSRYPALWSSVEQIVTAVGRIDRDMQAAATSAAKIAVAQRHFEESGDLIQQMAVAAHHFVDEDRDLGATSLDRAHMRLATLFAVVVLIVLIFAAVTWQQFRRLEQSRADLLQVTDGLAAEKERAVLASQAKSIFLANMSHELRTPLNAIIGFADVIASQMLGPAHPPRYAEYAGDIHRSGQHLLSLVNDLLDLARIEAGRMTIEPEWLDLRVQCATAMSTFEGEARRAGIALERRDVDVGLHVNADPRAFQQMLLNLLSNALKFTPAGGDVELAAEVVAGSLRLTVRDSGSGISPELMQHLMEPFVRGATQAVSGQQGTGLGLSITRRLMEMHGGQLELQSAVGRGTTAVMVFPASAVAEAEQAAAHPPLQPRAAEAA